MYACIRHKSKILFLRQYSAFGFLHFNCNIFNNNNIIISLHFAYILVYYYLLYVYIISHGDHIDVRYFVKKKIQIQIFFTRISNIVNPRIIRVFPRLAIPLDAIEIRAPITAALSDAYIVYMYTYLYGRNGYPLTGFLLEL